MRNDKEIKISIGGSRKALVWQQQSLMWSAFCDKLANPVRSAETLEEYMALPKIKQDELKDVGGYVGGTLAGERRKASNVTGRDLVTLDMDQIPTSGTADVIRRVQSLGCASAIYSTRKHSDYAPRLRVVIPLSRTALADEYEPIARMLAKLIGIQFCDPTTFEAVRLMYWPSVSRDAEYVYQVHDAGFCDTDGILGMFEDWHDIRTWPQVPGADAIEKRRLAKQEDPTAKKGIVGAFCRSYTITEAMEKFIPGMYEPTTEPGRYTFTGGSTAGGAVLYDNDRFLYSHHATDPCSGQLVNAWDLIRLHMYGDLDDQAKEGTPIAKMPSYTAMKKLAVSDENVSDLMSEERVSKAHEAFGSPEEILDQAENESTAEVQPEEDVSWIKKLSLDGNGNFQKTINNCVLILQNDPLLKGKVVTDEFAGCGRVTGKVPWSTDEEPRRWVDRDDDGARWYLETFYGIPAKDKIASALSIVGGYNTINEVRDYLQSLKWDGVRRLDTLLVDYLGANDNPYVRAVMRKSLTAAVARAIVGGIKYDFMPIIVGPQGIGKSTFLATLGGKWFSDSLTTFSGKDAAEMLRGVWINEIGELTAFSRQETNEVKQFLSKRADIYRAAYGRHTEEYPRRCVFFGTSNDDEFLQDSTGNRRFWPVDVGGSNPTKDVWKDLPGEVDQIWAEAMVSWTLGEPLYMTGDLQRYAEIAQEEHTELSAWEGKIIDFVERKVPENWNGLSEQARKAYWANPIEDEGTRLIERDRICATEIWAECFRETRAPKQRDTRDINKVLKKMPGWEAEKTPRRHDPYGKARGFQRKRHL